MNLDHQLHGQLKTLRLGGFMESLDVRLQQAQSSSLGYLDFLQLLVQDEIERREGKKLSVRLTKASFEEEKTLEGFDFTFNLKVNHKLIRDLATCAFVEKGEHVLLYGPRAQAKATSPKPSAIRHAAKAITSFLQRPSNSSASSWPAGPITLGTSAPASIFIRTCSS
jgi:hypothetical protein